MFGKNEMRSNANGELACNVGSFSAQESRLILKSLEAANIPFQIETSDEEIRNQGVLQAQAGGTFGSGAQVTIYISEGDVETFHEIYSRITFGKEREPTADQINEGPDPGVPYTVRPNLFVLVGFWFLGLLMIAGGIGVGVALAQSGHFIVCIPFFGLITLISLVIYRTTQEYFRNKRTAEQSHGADGGSVDS